jgi:hypothetical protein
MATESQITILDTQTGTSEIITTSGHLLLYFDSNGKIKMSGKMNPKLLMPFVADILKDKLKGFGI